MPQTQSTIATIPKYDAQSAEKINARLRKLSQAELAELEAYERRGQARSTVLERIASLRGEMPWSGYDAMEVEEVKSALKRRDDHAASRVLEYERQHKARATVIEFAQRQRQTSAGTNGSEPRTGTRGRASSARTSRSRSSAKASTKAGPPSSRSAGRGTRSTSGSRSKSSRSRQARASKTAASSRTSSSSSAGGTRRKRTQVRSGSKSQARRSGARGGSRKSAPDKSKQGVAGALRNAESRAESAAKDAGSAVGDTATNAGQAIGVAAKNVKGPAIATGVAAAALGGGLLLGSKLGSKIMPQRKILGITIPGRRSRISQVRRSIGKVRNRVLEESDRVETVGKQLNSVNEGIQKLSGRPD